MALKHTDFMQTIAKQIGDVLAPPYQNYHLGETRWFCQVFFGDDRRNHYEVSRVWNRDGRQIEVGLHLESRNRQENYQALTLLDQHLIEIRHTLGDHVKAEVWDRGWAKIYELYPDEDLTKELAIHMTEQLARFITVVQPIYEAIKRTK